MGTEPRAWVLNLDADDELVHGGAHTPTHAMTARIHSLRATLEPLVRDDVVLWPGEPVDVAGYSARAWSPTRWAKERFTSCGVTLEGPSQAVLRAVNHRSFVVSTLPGAAFVTARAQLDQHLRNERDLAASSQAMRWLLKRPLGYAGKGRRSVPFGPLAPADEAWISASLRDDGLQVEPLVARELDAGLHGWLDRDGTLTEGTPTVQVIDSAGVWQRSRLAEPGELSASELAELRASLRMTAAALASTGYFGPFGIDAYRWRAPDGSVRFEPRCELNARYSMGWAIGMGERRPDRL